MADLRHSLDFFIFPFSKINELQSPQGTERADIESGGAALPSDGDEGGRGAGTSLGEEAALASVPEGVLQAQGQVRRGEDAKETRVYAEAAKRQEHEGTESAATRVTPGEKHIFIKILTLWLRLDVHVVDPVLAELVVVC